MKILQINTVINKGSTGRICEEIGNVILNNGWESHIAFGRNPRSCKSASYRIANRLDVLLHVLLTRIFDLHGKGSIKSTKNLIRYITKIKPDLIHLHNIHGYYLNIHYLFTYLNNSSIPIVWTLHDCWPFTGHCAYFSYVKCTKWQSQCFKCPQINQYPKSILIDNSRKNYNDKKRLFSSNPNLTLVPVSNWLGKILSNSFLSKKRVNVIHNGINIEVFKPVDSKIRMKYNLESKFIILGVANIWEERKGLKDFLTLSSSLEKDEVIILIGITSHDMNKLPSNIIGINRTENINELAEFYSTSDVYLNLTYEDNFPTTNLESLACGTPVITYNTGGSPEAIDEYTGIIVEQGNISDAVLAIRKIKSFGKKHYTLNCRKRAIENYNNKDRFNEYLLLYKELTEKNS